MSGVVAPAAFERRQRVRIPWHDRQRSSAQCTLECDLRKTAVVVMVLVRAWDVWT